MHLEKNPEKEYELLYDFYKNNSDVDLLPANLRKVEAVYRFAIRLIEKGYLSQQTIVNMTLAEFAQRDKEQAKNNCFNLTQKTCWRYVTDARRFYNETQFEDKVTHRLRLTKLLYKQIEILTLAQKNNPIKASEAIAKIIEKIADINNLKAEDVDPNAMKGEIYFVLSDNAKEFPELNEVTDDELFGMIDQFSKQLDLSDDQRNKLIRKDVAGYLVE